MKKKKTTEMVVGERGGREREVGRRVGGGGDEIFILEYEDRNKC